MPSTNFSAVDLLDTDTGHVNGPRGHDALNAAMDIATRPGSVRTVSHSSAGALSIDADALSGGHVARITVGANITSFAMTNMTTGLPFLLILEGNGVTTFTANLSSINIDSSTTLDSAVNVGPADILAVCFVKTKDGDLWAPAGLLSYGTASSSGITAIGFGSLPYTGSFVTSISVPIPSGVQSGDLIEIVVQTQESSDPGAITTPGGWTARSGFSNTPSAGFIPRLSKIYKIASGSEGGTNQSVTVPSSRPTAGSMVWRGVNTTTPYDASAAAANMGNGNPDPGSVTTVTNNAFVVAYAAGNKTGGLSCTPPTGYTKTLDQSANDRSNVIAYKLIATAGAENPAAFGWAVDNHTCITDSLRPA